MASVLFTLQDGAAGGTERRVVQVARGLLDRGHDVTVAIPHRGEIGRHLQTASVRTEEVPYLRLRRTKNPLYYLAWLCSIPVTALRIAAIAKRRHIEVIYSNQITQVQPALAAKLMRRKLVWHLMGVHWPRRLERVFFPMVRRFSDWIVMSSEANVARARELHGFSGPCTVIHAPVDTSRFRPATQDGTPKRSFRRALGVDSGTFLVGTVCHINQNKGLEVLMNAAALVSRAIPRARFVVVGPVVRTQQGYFERLLELRARLTLSEKLLFSRAREDIPEVLQSLDAFVLPSWNESSPLALLEAMATGLPVIASRVGGVPEIIDASSGILFEAGDSRALAAAIIDVAKDRDLSKALARRARERVVQGFSLELAIDRAENVIQAVLGR